MDVPEVDEIGIDVDGGDCKDKTVKRLLSKNLNEIIDYLTPSSR